MPHHWLLTNKCINAHTKTLNTLNREAESDVEEKDKKSVNLRSVSIRHVAEAV